MKERGGDIFFFGGGGCEIFGRRGVEKFPCGWEIRGVKMFSGGVEIFQEGLKFFRGGGGGVGRVEKFKGC